MAIGKDISNELENKLEKRESYLAVKGERNFISLFEEMPEEYAGQAICPILSEGDIIGGVILLEQDARRKMGEVEQKLIQAAAGFLGRQMEQ